LIFLVGLGLHLKSLAQKLPERFDLHEPHRLLIELTEYEHLHRIFRMCNTHVARYIRNANVPEAVRNKMRSLVCVRHDSWDETLQAIQVEGGKAGAGNVF
jgi:hypothetical protein